MTGHTRSPVTLALVSAVAHGCGNPPTVDEPVDPVATTITVAPAIDTVFVVDGTVQFSATVIDQNGRPMTGVTVNWDSDDPSVATIDAAGLATAVAEGLAGITARAGNAVGTASIEVTPIAEFAIARDSIFLTEGATDALTLTITTDDGTALTVGGIQWHSDNTDVVSVSATGELVATGLGQALVTATLESFSATAIAQVLPTQTKMTVVELDPTVANAAAFIDVIASAYGTAAAGAAIRIPDDAETAGVVAALDPSNAVLLAGTAADASISLSGSTTAEWLVSTLVPIDLLALQNPPDLIPLIRGAADYAALVDAIESAATAGQSFVDVPVVLDLAEAITVAVVEEIAPVSALSRTLNPVRGDNSPIVVEDATDSDTDMTVINESLVPWNYAVREGTTPIAGGSVPGTSLFNSLIGQHARVEGVRGVNGEVQVSVSLDRDALQLQVGIDIMTIVLRGAGLAIREERVAVLWEAITAAIVFSVECFPTAINEGPGAANRCVVRTILDNLGTVASVVRQQIGERVIVERLAEAAIKAMATPWLRAINLIGAITVRVPYYVSWNTWSDRGGSDVLTVCQQDYVFVSCNPIANAGLVVRLHIAPELSNGSVFILRAEGPSGTLTGHTDDSQSVVTFDSIVAGRYTVGLSASAPSGCTADPDPIEATVGAGAVDSADMSIRCAYEWVMQDVTLGLAPDESAHWVHVNNRGDALIARSGLTGSRYYLWNESIIQEYAGGLSLTAINDRRTVAGQQCYRDANDDIIGCDAVRIPFGGAPTVLSASGYDFASAWGIDNMDRVFGVVRDTASRQRYLVVWDDQGFHEVRGPDGERRLSLVNRFTLSGLCEIVTTSLDS